jgi:hypothetical protein
MNKPSDILLDGLVEGVGQELKPYGPQSNSSMSPMQPQDGQWAFRFNNADSTKVSVFVTVNFGPPFSLAADLFSEMNEAQVESLANWLTRVLKVMKQAA